MIIGLNKNISTNRQNNTFGKAQKPVSSLINEGRLVDTFVTLVKIDSGSDEKIAETKSPSTEGQKDVAKKAREILKEIGFTEIKTDKHSMVTATLESNMEGDVPVIGLFAHMDSSFDAPNKGIQPVVHDYKGGDINLKEGTTIPEADLKAYVGQKIVTSDGRTLLSGDDKMGMADIIEAVRVLKENPDIKRPKIKVAFTVDEETGMGIKRFDIKRFGADAAYTVDGDRPSLLENESFNAYNPKVTIHGVSTHTGEAKGKMKNAIKIATWIIDKLPKNQAPETTEKRQGFYHPDSISGDVSKTEVTFLVRDFTQKGIKRRMAFMQKLVKEAKEKFGCVIDFKPNKKYGNMKVKIDELPEVVTFAKKGIQRSGLAYQVAAIRGGTDGSELTLNGLPTPNIGTGAHNYHSQREFVSVEEAKKSTENIIHILSIWAENAAKVMPKILERRKI